MVGSKIALEGGQRLRRLSPTPPALGRAGVNSQDLALLVDCSGDWFIHITLLAALHQSSKRLPAKPTRSKWLAASATTPKSAAFVFDLELAMGKPRCNSYHTTAGIIGASLPAS